MGNNFRAVIEGQEEIMIPCFMSNCGTPFDAAAGFAESHIAATDGEWTSGAIKVWKVNADFSDDGQIYIFDIKANVTSCGFDEDDEEEFECELEILERE